MRKRVEDTYQHHVMPLTERLGLHDFLIRAYRGGHRQFGPSTVTHRVADTKVCFPADKSWQHDRFFFLEERALLADLLAEVAPDDVVYDVGAYVGSHTIAAAAATPGAETIAFEPHPASYRRLTEVVEWSDHDITAHNLALAEDERTATVRETAEPRAGLYDDGDGVEVQAVRGDQLIAEEGLPTPSVLKLDVEGAEVGVLRGLSETLIDPTCRLVYCELHPGLTPADVTVPDDLETILKDAGFNYTCTTYGTKKFLRAAR